VDNPNKNEIIIMMNYLCKRDIKMEGEEDINSSVREQGGNHHQIKRDNQNGNGQTVVRMVNTAVGNSTGQAGTFLAAGASLMVVYLVSGAAITTCQYGLHLIVKELSTDPKSVVFSPLLAMTVASAGKIGLGSILCVFFGGGLRKIGTIMASNSWIDYWENVFYHK
jgi:hypothetical protein